MKRHNNIYEKIYELENLEYAHIFASQDKSHYKDVIKTNQNLQQNLLKIQEQLKNKTYKITPNDYTFKTINEGKERELMKLKYNPHRIVQWAIMLQIEKYFKQTFCNHTCSSIPGRGIKRAVGLTMKYLKDEENTKYCLKIDVRKFYPSINKEILKSKLKRKFKDPDLLWVLNLIIDSYPKERGVPIGSYLSQYFANFYLSDFDHWLKETKGCKYVVRYMDDVIILHNSKEFLHNLLKEIQEFWTTKLDVQMKHNFQVFPVDSRGIDFVGYVFKHHNIRLRKKNALKLRKISNSIQKRSKLGKLMTRTQFCAVNSYLGMFQHFDSCGLFEQYIRPIYYDIVKYYQTIKGQNKTSSKFCSGILSKNSKPRKLGYKDSKFGYMTLVDFKVQNK